MLHLFTRGPRTTSLSDEKATCCCRVRRRGTASRLAFAAILAFAVLLVPVAQASAAKLTINPAGSGSGTVTSAQTGGSGNQINCHWDGSAKSGTCAETFTTTVGLTATNNSGSTFAGWTKTSSGGLPGTCSGTTNTCTTGSLILAALTLTATFNVFLPPPTVTISAPTAIGPSEATFHGTVNPNGNDAKWRFEYRPVGAPVGRNAPVPDGDAGSGETAEPVEALAEELEPNTEYEVRLRAANETSSETSGVETFDTLGAAPAVSIGKAWSVSDMAATLAATANPHNATVTDCRFEYGTTTAYGQDIPCQPAPGSGGAPVQVIAEVEGLSPSTAYHFRVVAANECAAGCGSEAGGDASFETYPSLAPSYRGYELVSAADTNGIDAQPNIASLDGDYYSYFTYIPAPGASNGNTSAATRAVRQANGSWRQVGIGTPPRPGEPVSQRPPDLSTEDLSLAAIPFPNQSPDPDDQNGPNGGDLYLQDLDSGVLTWLSRNPAIAHGVPQTEAIKAGTVDYISPDGRIVLFESLRNLLPSDQSSTTDTASLYQWSQQAANGRQSLAVNATGGDYTVSKTAAIGEGVLTSASTSVTGVTVTSSGGAFHVGDAISGMGIPSGTTITEVGSGTLTLSTAASASGSQILTATETTSPIAADSDALEMQSALGALAAIGAGNVTVSGGPGDAGATHPYTIEFTNALAGTYRAPLSATNLSLTGGAPSPSAAVIVVVPGGHLSLVGVLPDQTNGPSTGSRLGSGGFDIGAGTTYGAASADGSVIAFQSGDGNGRSHLYVRQDGERTLEASKSVGVSPEVTSPFAVTYQGAGVERKKIFFTSSSALTADSLAPNTSNGAADLYAYNAEDEGLHDLTPEAGGGAVIRVYAVSEDGRRVYFSSRKQLTAGQGAAGGPNLYLAKLDEHGELAAPLTFIATIDSQEDELGSASNSGGMNGPQRNREAATSASGAVLAFRDSLPAVPARQTGGLPQVFVYDAGRTELSCASCPSDGTSPTSAANLSPSDLNGAGELVAIDQPTPSNPALPYSRNVSADGTVFFQTASSLVSSDTNGLIDVYEWHGNSVDLVSTGVGNSRAVFGDASADGSTVFFRSASSLVSGAQAGVGHVYAARVGSPTFSSPTAVPPCGGEDCRTAPGPAPSMSSPTSNAFQGTGNLKPRRSAAKRCPKGKVRKHGVCVKKRNHHRARNHDRRAANRHRGGAM